MLINSTMQYKVSALRYIFAYEKNVLS